MGLWVKCTQPIKPEMKEYLGKGKVIKKMLSKNYLFSLFQIITFPNDACGSSIGDTGLCLSASECQGMGGTISGFKYFCNKLK